MATCSNCEAGRLHPTIVTVTKTTRRGTYTIQVPGDECDACDEKTVSATVTLKVIDPWVEQITAEEAKSA